MLPLFDFPYVLLIAPEGIEIPECQDIKTCNIGLLIAPEGIEIYFPVRCIEKRNNTINRTRRN